MSFPYFYLLFIFRPSQAFRHVLAALWSRDHSLDHSQLPKYPTSSANESEITLASGS